MAVAAAASAAAISSVSLSRGHHHLPAKSSIFSFSFNLSSQKVLPLFWPRPNFAPTSLPSKIRASSSSSSDDVDDNDFESSFSPFSPSPSISAPKKFSPSFGLDPTLRPPLSPSKSKPPPPHPPTTSTTTTSLMEGKKDDTFEERLVQVRRVTKVVKGGKQLRLRVGDKQGRVGVGVGKGKEVTIAIEKSAKDARRNIIIEVGVAAVKWGVGPLGEVSLAEEEEEELDWIVDEVREGKENAEGEEEGGAGKRHL